MLLPRFSLDQKGVYAVSHCPLMYPEVAEGESAAEMLRYFLAILNSSVAHWQIARLAHRYSRGYMMLEVKTLKKIAVPDPGKVPVAAMKRLHDLALELIRNPDQESLDRELDSLVAGLYDLTPTERLELGLEGQDGGH